MRNNGRIDGQNKSEVSVAEMPAREKSILVVDDDPAICDVLVTWLEQEDYTVRCAANGREALEQVAEHKPSLILVDLMMPVMDGYTFLSHLRQDSSTQDIPVIVLSADRYADERLQELHYDAYLPKPFDLFRVSQLIEHYLCTA